MNYYYNNFRGIIPHLSTKTTLCILGKVQFNLEVEERSPKTPPLTLTAITKPLSNNRKEKVKEIEEEKRRIENPEQALILSNAVRKKERQSSPSFDWMNKPQTEVYHNEQSEISKQQGSNAKLIEMMIKMEQNIGERDN